jgi:hypothetical protein
MSYLLPCPVVRLFVPDMYIEMLFRLYRALSIISIMFIVKTLVGSAFVHIIKCLLDDNL